MESEEIGKVILNVNKYLNELKSSSIIKISEYIKNDYIKKQQLLDLKTINDNNLKQYETYKNEIIKILSKANEEKQILINKFEDFQEKIQKDQNKEIEEKDNKENNNENIQDNENNNISNSKELVDKKNDTQINSNNYNEIKYFYKELIENFNNIFQQINKNLEEKNKELVKYNVS